MKSLFLAIVFLLFSANTLALPNYCPKTMTIVFYGNWYPYMFYDQGTYQGIDYDFMKLIMDKLGCEVVVNAIPEKRAHLELAQGDSLIMTGASITAQRQEHAYFSAPYRGERISLFYLSGDRELVLKKSADDIVAHSSVIAINAAAYYGSTVENLRRSQYKPKFIHIPSLARRVEMLVRNRVQAMVEDHTAGCYALHQASPEIKERIRWLQVNRVDVAFMFSKGVVPHAFVAIFNNLMQQLIVEGRYEEIVAKYTPQGC